MNAVKRTKQQKGACVIHLSSSCKDHFIQLILNKRRESDNVKADTEGKTSTIIRGGGERERERKRK